MPEVVEPHRHAAAAALRPVEPPVVRPPRRRRVRRVVAGARRRCDPLVVDEARRQRRHAALAREVVPRRAAEGVQRLRRVPAVRVGGGPQRVGGRLHVLGLGRGSPVARAAEVDVLLVAHLHRRDRGQPGVRRVQPRRPAGVGDHRPAGQLDRREEPRRRLVDVQEGPVPRAVDDRRDDVLPRLQQPGQVVRVEGPARLEAAGRPPVHVRPVHPQHVLRVRRHVARHRRRHLVQLDHPVEVRVHVVPRQVGGSGQIHVAERIAWSAGGEGPSVMARD